MRWLALGVALYIVISTFIFHRGYCSDFLIIISLFIGALGWIILFAIDN